ncbi:hypothetical protein ACLK2H_21140 [Escherichia coli]
MATGDGFARRRERFKIQNVIGIDAAKDDELPAVFIFRVSGKMRHRITGGACPTFLIDVVHQAIDSLNRIRVITA